MPNLSIKDVPMELLERLRRRADANHRSLQGEMMSILTEALGSSVPSGTVSTASVPGSALSAPGPRPSPSNLRIGGGILVGTKTIEQVAAEILERRTKPATALPKAVDILRSERDAR